MNDKDRIKYEKSKYIVKKWESEFKIVKNELPTKTDIKCAPKRIKDAYRSYWTLKNLLKNTSVGSAISVDENAKDCFNSSDTSEHNQHFEESNKLFEDSQLSLAPLSDTLNQSSCGFNSCDISKISPIKPDQPPRSNELTPTSFKNLFGKDQKNNVDIPDFIREIAEKVDLEKDQKEKEKKLGKKSISFQYAEKLFAGSKFNKRNPRKPRDLAKSKSRGTLETSCSSGASKEETNSNSVTSSSLPEKSSLFSQNTEDLLLENKTFATTSVAEKDSQYFTDDDAKFALFDEKLRVVMSAPTRQNQAVSLLQKTFDKNNYRPSIFRNVDKGWLDRISDKTEVEFKKQEKSDSQDSGIESTKSDTLVEGFILTGESSGAVADSEDEIICDSDSESQSQSTLRLNLFDKVLNRSNSSFTELKSNQQTDVKSKSNFGNISASQGTVIPLDNNRKQGNCFGIRKRTQREDSSPELPPSKKPKSEVGNEYEFVSTTKPELVRSFEPVRKNKVSVSTSKMGDKDEAKRQLLEAKLQSGKANENFVRINIEKKRYVRGRKKMTGSKYKKQQWKDIKKAAGEFGGSSGVLKCFRCGDVGHFSKACPKGSGLLPLEDVDIEEESPFPTLEEVEEMAREAAEKAHRGRRQYTTSDKIDTECPVAEEEPLGKLVKPLYRPNEDGSLIDTPEEVYCALRELGYPSFRPGQEEGVMRVLSGLNTVVTLSTGSGKSLIYQLPALLYSKAYPDSITLVISPLVSLMEDQVYCGSKMLRTACLHHNISQKKREVVMDSLKSRSLSVLLVAPESLSSWDSARSLFSILPPIAFACIDEAHSISQSSHNFRPTYLTICKVLREKLGVSTLLGLTATASRSTLDMVKSQLGVPPDTSPISNQPLPDNLLLSVSCDSNRKDTLIQLLHSARFSSCDSIIIYCTRRDECDKIAAFLRTALQEKSGANKKGRLSLHAEAYHAGLTSGRRNQVQTAFMSGKLRIVVATVAFGMGINKNNIRGIIHYNMPSSFESYVQEVGRAGRDGLPAHCHVFIHSKGDDLNELRRHIYADTMDRHVLRRLLQLVFVSCGCGKASDPSLIDETSSASRASHPLSTSKHNSVGDGGVEESCRHEVAFPVEKTVKSLDLPQEVISTLLAYLELDQERWIQVLPLAYTECKVTSYKGPRHLRQLAKQCPPLAMVMAESGGQPLEKSTLEFDVIELSRRLNWDSGIVKNTLKQLEWTKEDGKPRKSGVVVDLNCLGFRVLAPGSLTDARLDQALDLLHSKVQGHEELRLRQLKLFYDSLKKVSHKDISAICEDVDEEKCEQLKSIIREYFTNDEPLRNVQPFKDMIINEEGVAMDIRRLISLHQNDAVLTGRSIARIFHGIASPNFPPIVWGRTPFWRMHLDKDFRSLVSLANRQLVLMR